MAIDKKRIDDFEKKYKDVIFGKINEVSSKQFESINLMTTNARNMGQANVDIPNASITLNNKLVELSQIFKSAGISMFSSAQEKYDHVGSSFLGDAIIEDLIEQLSQSSEKLGEYSQAMGSVSKKKTEKLQALQNVSPIQKFFSKIKAFFVPTKPVDLSLSEDEQSTLEAPLQEYRDIDNKIWNYKLEDRLVPALVKAIAGPQKFGEFDIPHRYSASGVPGLLEECVIPDLKKLGLESLIPQLQEALIEEYKKDLPDPEIYQVEDEYMHLYVPDFSSTPQEPRQMTEQEMQELHEKAQEVIKDSKKTLKSIKRERLLGGLGIKNFAAIDSTVSAPQRKEATTVISTELSQEQSRENTPVVEKDGGISIE